MLAAPSRRFAYIGHGEFRALRCCAFLRLRAPRLEGSTRDLNGEAAVLRSTQAGVCLTANDHYIPFQLSHPPASSECQRHAQQPSNIGPHSRCLHVSLCTPKTLARCATWRFLLSHRCAARSSTLPDSRSRAGVWTAPTQSTFFVRRGLAVPPSFAVDGGGAFLRYFSVTSMMSPRKTRPQPPHCIVPSELDGLRKTE